MRWQYGALGGTSAFVLAVIGAASADATDAPALQLNLASPAILDVAASDLPLVAASDNAGLGSGGDFFDDWFARVAEAQASQPHWMTPLATVTPRLEQEFRYDQYWEHLGSGASVETFDSGKGLELIPTTTNEVLINLPTYEDRGMKKPAQGWGDWPFLVVKQRLLSAPEDQGNYILSVFLGVQAPSGNAAFTSHAWVVTPTLAGGVGWGDFDVQGTVGVGIPVTHESDAGTSVATNVTLQYQFAKYFWPELEVNDTYWSGGPRSGKNQTFLTPGLILGRFALGGRAKFIIGAGYQFAVAPSKTVLKPVLTPTYDRSWLMSARLAF